VTRNDRLTCETQDNPHCAFPHCLDGACDSRCIKQEYRELSRAEVRKRAKAHLEAMRIIENEMDG